MYRKELNEHSPLRILERSIHGGLGAGNFGVVMARAGAGKTAVLVQIGLDDLMRDRKVLHVALGQTLEHVHTWYDALFDDLAALYSLEEKETVRASIGKNRVIQAFASEHHLTPERLEKILELYSTHMQLKPSAILIDGWDWEGGSNTKKAAELGALKGIAKRLGAELWMTAQTHRSVTSTHPNKVTEPCEPYVDLIDVAIFLEPHGTHCTVRLLKDHGDATPHDTHLQLDCNTLRIAEDSEDGKQIRLPPSAYTLLSGGANGAEAEFGACAERFGLHEVNYSFSGRAVARERGLVELNEAELRQGNVSPAYVEAQLHRKFPNTPIFQKTLQSIWHQVATAGEVFVVGHILPDKTVKGGTGWAAELARHFNKPLHVYDQEKKGWFAWKSGEWVAEETPRITTARFAGTGTRFLTAEGKAAINTLFETSFKS